MLPQIGDTCAQIPASWRTTAQCASNIDSKILFAPQIGDTWIHGVASDAGKVADYRAMQRMRRKLSYDHSQDPAYRNMSRFLLKVQSWLWRPPK